MAERSDLQDLDRAAVGLAEQHGQPHRRRVGRAATGAARRSAARSTQVLRGALARAAQEHGPARAPADEWLLDNAHVIEGALRQTREDLPGGFVRTLPVLPGGAPRVHALACGVLDVPGGFDAAGAARFVRAYQGQWPLTLGELWALPAYLRLETLDRLLRSPPQGEVVARAVQTLRALNRVDWLTFVESVSVVEAALQEDPARVYARMDRATRNQYRQVVERLARAARQPEVDVARTATGLMAPGEHVGHALLAEPDGHGLTPLERALGIRPGLWRAGRRALWRARLGVYVTALLGLFMLTVTLLLGVASRAGAAPWALAVLAALCAAPALVNATTLLHWASSFRAPRVLPKLEPVAATTGRVTLVVIPCLLSDADEVQTLLRRLERHALGNGDPDVQFALLSDHVDAPQATMPGDDALLAQAQAGVDALNRRRGPQFHLFHRPREFSAAEGCWMGRERKRGKLMDLGALLLNGTPGLFSVPAGRPAALEDVRYVLTLDADTWLPPGTLRTLVGTFDHPLNRPVWDERGRLRAGYTVLQPRVEPHPRSVQASRYVRAITGGRGLDLYAQAVSEAYQDLFAEGTYAGKGLYDLAAFDRSVRGRVPDGQVLSHDLLEGALGRAAFVSDVPLIEGVPSHYLAFTRRMERWVRGDWQLLPWLGGRGAALGTLGRWKVLHNLARSLHPVGVLGVLALAWSGALGGAFFWTLLALLALTGPLLVSSAAGLLGSVRVRSGEQLLAAMVDEGQRTLLTLTFLPFESLVILGAVSRALGRTFVTRRRLLEWTPAGQVDGQLAARAGPGACWRAMWGAPVLAAALGALAARHPGSWPLAAPLLLAWACSPQLAWQLSRPPTRRAVTLSPLQRRAARLLARRTWLFFERFVGPDDHWLPPDHFQEHPLGVAAHRTSPTNIGLMLTATLSAYDLGYLGPLELTARLQATLDTLGRLERHEGHLLNWYDTRSLAPLPPPYVSTVDSGNLTGHLIALRQGLLSLPDEPVWRAQRWEGLLDTLALLDAALPAGGARTRCAQMQELILANLHPSRWSALLDASDAHLAALEAAVLQLVETADPLDEPTLWEVSTWFERLRHHLVNLRAQRDSFLPWLAAPPLPAGLPPGAWSALPCAPRLAALPDTYRQAHAALDAAAAGATDAAQRAWCEQQRAGLRGAAGQAAAWLDTLAQLTRDLDAEIERPRWGFLFDPQRELFTLGYRPDLNRPDPNAYDLLASEARLASFVAIALRQVPATHWLHLARPMTRVGGRRLLLSWSGTAFEYLMPGLLMRAPPDSLLGVACASAVATQRAHGRHHGVPWGVSESGYARLDANLNYQYRAFGVPGLGLQRGLADDLVIAPYASLLALPWQPAAVIRNLARLGGVGLLGRYGLFEAADYTPARLPVGARVSVVRSYMAHHQGMTLLSVANALAAGQPGRPGMVERFHADPRVASAELLLYEQVPYAVPLERLHLDQRRAPPGQVPGLSLEPWAVPGGGSTQLHLLSNGRYSVLIGESGGGATRWNGLQLSRFRADPARLDCGHWIYVQDLESGICWTLTSQPRGTGTGEALLSAHSAQFQGREAGVTSLLDVTVDAALDAEVRRITLRADPGSAARRLRITCVAEAVLGSHAADLAHPAFQKLFVQSEWAARDQTLLLRRRSRSPQESQVWWGHFLTSPDGVPPGLTWTAARAQVLGRHGSARDPQGLLGTGRLTGTVGVTLDAVAALQVDVTLRPGRPVTLAWVAVAAETRASALTSARTLTAWARVQAAFSDARREIHRSLRAAGIGTPELELGARLLSALTYPRAQWRTSVGERHANPHAQRDLWPLGLSGDHPVLLLHLRDAEHLEALSQLLRLHRHWREREVLVDLALLNDGDQGYGQDVTLATARLITASGADSWLGRAGGLHLVRGSALSGAARQALLGAARVQLSSADGPLDEQLRRHAPPADLPPLLPSRSPWMPTVPDRGGAPLTFWNGLGGFTPTGDEYHLRLQPGQTTPRPWVNVIASPAGGFVISEAGGGFSWAGNSGENRLTAWTNDPVSDTPSDTLYLRDEATAQIWTPTPQPAPSGAPCLIRHGWGYTAFEQRSHDLAQHLLMSAAPDDPVKIMTLSLRNEAERARHVSVTCTADFVLGPHRDGQAPHLLTDFDADHGALLVRNPWRDETGAQVAFLAVAPAPQGVTTDRLEFLGQGGTPARPAALTRVGLSGTVDPPGDPGAALQVHLHLPPGGQQTVTVLLGAGHDAADTARLLDTYLDPGRCERAVQDTRARWQHLLGRVIVKTPDPAFDVMLNGWLLYQTLSCRVWGRSGLYQSSGAYGFRDQLQDVLALLHAAPNLAREQILRHAARQFTQGDALHWWHPPMARGVRTRISDDLLWLPYVTAAYVTVTGDTGILNEVAPFLTGAELEPAEHERYDTYAATGGAPLYEHLLRAVRHASRTGRHGLPLMGTGDWNDGLNLIGAGGQGESVWLGFFLHRVLNDLLPLCRLQGDDASVQTFTAQAQALGRHLEQHGWDGQWYRRAYRDDGSVLGSAGNRECRIDAVAQSWAVLSGAADPTRARLAMNAVRTHLLDEDAKLSLLLTPPFDRSAPHPGYIQGYPPGIRENGAQYTHAAVWTAWAFAELGDASQAHTLFQWLNPIHRTSAPADVATYQTEPYVMTADVASHPQRRGEGGWSWYTGSAAWTYRLGLEQLLGIRRTGASLRVQPCIPDNWSGYQVTYHHGTSRYELHVDNRPGGAPGVTVDGHPLAGSVIPLLDDGATHQVQVTLR
ncbi:GH36-type glycosyl hydrolase domain-containing protein [Deinococcus daejeonensis]|nr:glucoamylase family protein [Deinococcus daejeonensis]